MYIYEYIYIYMCTCMYTYLHIPRMMLCLFEESLERKASPGSFDIWTKKNTQDTYIDTHKNTYKNTCSGHADIAVGGAKRVRSGRLRQRTYKDTYIGRRRIQGHILDTNRTLISNSKIVVIVRVMCGF